jgi:hypothetical protein
MCLRIPKRLNADHWFTEEEADRLLDLPVECIAQHFASYERTGTVQVGDIGKVTEMGEIGGDSGLWLIAVTWNRRSDTKD